MFVSTDYLAIHYGVDEKIGNFFADREPPADNLYWKGKLLYLRFEPGYLFIPLIVDIMFRLGVKREQLLSPSFINLMEAVGHISALEETKQITANEAVARATELASHFEASKNYLSELQEFFRGDASNKFTAFTTPFKALHRGDLFLFSLAALDIEEELYPVIVKHWFALISSLLLLDDADDVEVDRANGEQNAFLESGLNEQGLMKIKDLVTHNLQMLASINRSLAIKIDKQMVEVYKRPLFQQLLKTNYGT